MNRTVWLCEMDRFGYTLQVVGRTEKEAKEAMTAEYIKAFKNANDGEDPSEVEYNDSETYFDCFMEELYATEMEFGVVEWN